jgi:hypothetical protein
MEDNRTSKAEIEYAIGFLETSLQLISVQNPEILAHNLQHLKKILPIVISELKIS